MSESFLTSKGGCIDDVSFGTAGDLGAGAVADGDMALLVFDLLASGEFGRDGGARPSCAAACGGGVETLVITWDSRRRVNIGVSKF